MISMGRKEAEAYEYDQFRVYSMAELDDDESEVEYLVEGLVVKDQPGVIGGGEKCLKTTLALNMALSMATATPFLGRFKVARKVNVLVLSGESGKKTLRSNLKAMCLDLGLTLREIDNLSLADWVPRFDDHKQLGKLSEKIKEVGAEVVIIDPIYLAMPGESAGNMFVQGTMLRSVNDVCRSNGATLVMVHHTTKARRKFAEVQDLAFAGFSQFVRWWMMLSRVGSYNPAYAHVLNLNVGGSAGHSSKWSAAICTGQQGAPAWRAIAKEYSAEATQPEESRSGKRNADLVTLATNFLTGKTDGETTSNIGKQLGRNNTCIKKVIERMIESGAVEVASSCGKSSKYRLTGQTSVIDDGANADESQGRDGTRDRKTSPHTGLVQSPATSV